MDLPPVAISRPLAKAATATAPDSRDVARRFEALLVENLLRSARAGKLGDDGLGGDAGAQRTRDLTDRLMADAIAATGPFGLAKAIAPEAARPTALQ